QHQHPNRVGTIQMTSTKLEPSMPDEAVTVDYLMDNLWIVGDPSQCVEKIHQLYEESGGFGARPSITTDSDDAGWDQESLRRRLAAFVSLPLPHIDAALREMERGLDQLGMLGVSMTCSCFDRSTAEAEFEPLYQEMNRRGAVLNYHPIQNGICSPMINDYRFTV